MTTLEGKPKELSMSRPSWLQKLYWTKFAKPVEDRALFECLVSRPFSTILEVGIGDGSRMRRIAKLAYSADDQPIRYIGTDEFESADDDRRHLSLKQAHQLASQLGFKASLLPGDAAGAVPRAAHKFGTSELVILNGCLDPQMPTASPVSAWLEHITSDDSVILASASPESTLCSISLAAEASQSLRAA